MALPQIKPTDVETIVGNCKVIGPKLNGGQKIVFPCCVNGQNCALKIILLNNLSDDLDGTIDSKIEMIRARVEREIAIMKEINCPFIVKMGDVNLTATTFCDQNILFYSEEWIDGQDLFHLLQANKKLDVKTVMKLCLDITNAISELWKLNKIHRDIKPQNIIQRSENGHYVLLDLGLAFDLDDKSLTQYGFVPGTKMYFSPEQLDIAHKRDIDFRSDLFSLGIVAYQAITGIHPFYIYGMSDQELFYKIITQPVIQPNMIDHDIPKAASNLICRLLSKQPSGRYRKCEILISELNQILETMEV